ncbi:DNA-binding transcriptional LysR family regulator [Pullulanibacillus pueri]|uniref:LysR family transcriptional regulator n=1 Tax=Pullulanibacillus pueri TaxID=1437324 RepID=A0A8J2ZVI3_9BACL|nr:LysR family transcriptional regulator [Pullulanibacillus pueri]MBM7682359.1 DNA-binding transcriptional LysR family regulator [Pullulanibacillus pueri]GGH80658.1 LysR family transcriptional regulator [Pullulanibacillus pueri]
MDQALLVFITVAEQKNFTRAAEMLHMTQPAVSHYIKDLEQTMGTKLLERTNKYVRLNKAGEIVFYHAKEMLGLHTRMHSLVDDLLHTASGELIIGASYTFGEYILPHVLAELDRQYPLIKPTIKIGNTEKIAEWVADHQLDVGVVEGDLHHEKLFIEPFAEDLMYLIISTGHPLAQKSKICVGDLSGEKWIVREKGSGTREMQEKVFEALHIQPSEILEFGSTQVIKESVEAGLGITLLSQWAVRKEILLGTLKRVCCQGLPFSRKFSWVTQNITFKTKVTEVFLDILGNKSGFPQFKALEK